MLIQSGNSEISKTKWGSLFCSITIHHLFGNGNSQEGGCERLGEHTLWRIKWNIYHDLNLICSIWTMSLRVNGFIHLKWLPIFEFPKIWKIALRIFQIFEKPFSNFEFCFEKYIKASFICFFQILENWKLSKFIFQFLEKYFSNFQFLEK